MLVQHARLKAGPREFRACGRKLRRTGEVVLLVERGKEFPQEAFDFLVEQLTVERVTILSVEGKYPHEPPFVDEWSKRGYDASTLRFSISHLCGEKQCYPRPRVPRQRVGVLQARWGRIDDTVGDICTTFSGRNGRFDSRYFHSFLSVSLVSEPRNAFGRFKSWRLLEELKTRGFDITTLRFEVHHVDRTSRLAALRGTGSKVPVALPA